MRAVASVAFSIIVCLPGLTGCASTPAVESAADHGPAAMPFLLFQGGKAEEAMRFYVDTLPNSRIIEIDRYAAGETGPEGTVENGYFEVNGLRVRCTDSPIPHDFDFTPSFSFFIDLESAAELDRLAEALQEDGEAMMPPDDYGFSERFAWVQDRYGVSWQLNLPSAAEASD
jgi:predicted 3-demethylubiquinone-9 3-methyltransferase (glyoxalase superfamily)